MDPKTSRNSEAVMKGERANNVELKSLGSPLFAKLIDERRASAAATSTAASQPYNSRIKKMNVSETVISALTWGIWTPIREPNTIVTKTSNKNWRSRLEVWRRVSDQLHAKAPAAMMNHKNGL